MSGFPEGGASVIFAVGTVGPPAGTWSTGQNVIDANGDLWTVVTGGPPTVWAPGGTPADTLYSRANFR